MSDTHEASCNGKARPHDDAPSIHTEPHEKAWLEWMGSVVFVAALAGAITELATSAAVRDAMGGKALERARASFDWRRTVAEYLAVYDELIGGTPSIPGRKEVPHA